MVVLLFDRAQGWLAEDQALLDSLPPGIPHLVVANKADQPAAEPAADADVCISALTGEGHEALVDRLLQSCGQGGEQGLQVALNRRQLDLAVSAAASLQRTLEAGEQQLPWDFWTIDLRAAVRSLGEITGAEVTEAVLDRIFSRFCIGK